MGLDDEKIVLTSEEVIKLLRLPNKNALNWLCRYKKLPYNKYTKERTFIKASVLKWLKSQEVSHGL